MTPETRNTDCDAFEQTVQSVLDRERPLSALDHAHAMSCATCRDLAASARLLLDGLRSAPVPAPSPDLTNCILAAVITDLRAQRRKRLVMRIAGAAVAAALVVSGALWLSSGANETTPVAVVPTPPPTPVRMGDQLADAGAALASMTMHASERALPPSVAVPNVEVVSLPRTTDVEPTTDSLTALSSGAQSGLEPVATTTRRAVNMFLRDFSLVSTTKPKS